jgi:hypothetical protein
MKLLQSKQRHKHPYQNHDCWISNSPRRRFIASSIIVTFVGFLTVRNIYATGPLSAFDIGASPSFLPVVSPSKKRPHRIIVALDDGSFEALDSIANDESPRTWMFTKAISMDSPAILRNRTNHYMQSDDEEDDDHDCIPMHEWQTTQYPSCNNLHELFSTPSQLKYINDGTQSIVIGVNGVPYNDRIIFKGNLYHRSFNEDSLESRRKDAVVQERLTSSPYIMPIYGFCGSSVISPLAPGGSLFDVVHSARHGGEELVPMDKLKVGVQIAQGLAALHGIDKDRQPSFAHNDLDISQYMYHEGRFMLNDFNFGKFLYKNKYDNTTCKENSSMKPWLYRAPEDLTEKKGYGRTGPFRLDRADMFSLGAALYMVLTNKWMWDKRPGHVYATKLIKGERPPFPNEMLNSTDPSTQALIQATYMCWVHDPNQRPLAQEVASFLNQEFRRLVGAKNEVEAFKRLSVKFPPLEDGRDTYDQVMYAEKY